VASTAPKTHAAKPKAKSKSFFKRLFG
jgi:hypothetical protein